MEYLPLILSAVGGTVLGPFLSRLMGGGASMGLLGGLLGGIGGHFGADAAGLQGLLGSGAMGYVQSILEGGVGGGLISVILGAVTKKR